MKLPVALAFFLAFASSLVAQPVFVMPAGWRFGTQFPGAADTTADVNPSKGVAGQYSASFLGGGEVLAMFRTAFSASLPQLTRERTLAVERQKLGSDPAKTIKSEENVTICGRPGFRFIYEESGAEPSVTDLRAVVVGNEVYHFTYTRKPGAADTDASRAFFKGIKEKKQVY